MDDLVIALQKVFDWQQANPGQYVPPSPLAVRYVDIAEIDRLCFKALKAAEEFAPGIAGDWIATDMHRLKMTLTEGLLNHFAEKRIELRRALAVVKALAPDVSRPTTVLFLASDPLDASRLRLGQEVRDIELELKMAPLRSGFSLQQRFCVRAPDMSRALLEISPTIVHFSGHGTDRGELCLEDGAGRIHSVAPNDLASLFELVREHVSCVVLNACYSEAQAKAIARSIPNVIGMSKAVSDKAAIAFAVGFYQAVGAGRAYSDAYNFGCAQIRLQGVPEHLTPVLISSESSDSQR